MALSLLGDILRMIVMEDWCPALVSVRTGVDEMFGPICRRREAAGNLRLRRAGGYMCCQVTHRIRMRSKVRNRCWMVFTATKAAALAAIS